MRTWVVVYEVKYSEIWCADECSWIEHDEEVQAESPRGAQRAFRKAVSRLRFCIVGRHISTTVARR